MSRKLSREERLARDLANEEARAKERDDEYERNLEIYELVARLENLVRAPITCDHVDTFRDALVFLQGVKTQAI